MTYEAEVFPSFFLVKDFVRQNLFSKFGRYFWLKTF